MDARIKLVRAMSAWRERDEPFVNINTAIDGLIVAAQNDVPDRQPETESDDYRSRIRRLKQPATKNDLTVYGERLRDELNGFAKVGHRILISIYPDWVLCEAEIGPADGLTVWPVVLRESSESTEPPSGVHWADIVRDGNTMRWWKSNRRFYWTEEAAWFDSNEVIGEAIVPSAREIVPATPDPELAAEIAYVGASDSYVMTKFRCKLEENESRKWVGEDVLDLLREYEEEYERITENARQAMEGL
jgi:hypothetical protein